MPDTDETDTANVRDPRRSADRSHGNDADDESDEESDVDHFADALRATGEFVYANSHKLVVVSLAWTLASLPVVTVGPACLGAYVAIGQLASDRNRLETRQILTAVSERVIAATLFGLFPLVLFGISAVYLRAQVAESSPIRAAMFFLSLYAALYAALTMVPTFVGLADGEKPRPALIAGIRWTAEHPTLALLTGCITVVLLTATVLLTIAFPLIFAGAAASFHVMIVRDEH